MLIVFIIILTALETDPSNYALSSYWMTLWKLCTFLTINIVWNCLELVVIRILFFGPHLPGKSGAVIIFNSNKM